MLLRTGKSIAGVSAVAAAKYAKQQGEHSYTDAKSMSPPTKYFQIMDATLKERSPELRKKIYENPNELLGIRRYGKQLAVENGLINDDRVVSSLDGTEKKAAIQTFGLMRQLSNTKPGLGEKAARTTATMAANVYNTNKYLEHIQSPAAKKLRADFDVELGGKKRRKKRTKKNKRRKHRKTKKNRL
jgi:hypothetical protein